MATSQTCLGVDDLVDVLDLLKGCGFPKVNWYDLGLRLGLRKSTLDVIEKNHPHDVSRCMTECLSQWLSRADNVDSRGGANLDSLSDALQSMNETTVAEKLKHQVLINIFNDCHTVLSQSLCDSVSIAWLLYGERMLTQEAVSRVVSASPSIPNQRKYSPTPEVAVVPETIKDDHSVVFINNASTDETNIPTNPQSDTSDTKVASSQSQTLLPQVKIHVPVPKDLLTNFSSMRMSYGRMFYNVGKIIKRKSPPLEEIKEFLSCCGTILRRKVEQCTNISSVLRLIQNECSLTDIELLHTVVEEMEIMEATRCIETYRTELKEFCKSLSINLCLKERFASISHLQCETVTFIFDWEPEEHVLKDIKDILSKVSGKLLVIKYIETSTSISVTCSFPFSDVGFTVLRMIENIHILMGQGLKKLTIGNLTLWRRQDVRQKELKEKDQDSLQHTDVVSYIMLKEAEYKLRDAVSIEEKNDFSHRDDLSSTSVAPTSQFKMNSAPLGTSKEYSLMLLMKLTPHIPIERCRLVKYDYVYHLMEQSFDLDEFQHQTIGQIAGGTRLYYPFGLFIETREENKIFNKYHDGSNNLLISVVDLSTCEVGPAKPVRVEGDWTVGEFKQHIGEAYNLNSSCMRLVIKNYYGEVIDISDVGCTLDKIFRKSTYKNRQLVYVSSDPEDYKKDHKDSLMYKYIDFHFNSILLNITIPPGPEVIPTTTNVTEGGIIMKIISMENKGKERNMQVQVDKRITLAQLKEELVPLIGAPSTGFIVYEIRDNNEEYEMERLDEILKSGSKLIVRLGRALRRGEFRVKLYLLQVNNTAFCNFMMESIVAKNISVREFKEQIIEEAKVQGIDCVLELEKMRLRAKIGVSPGRVYFDDESIDTTSEMYVEPLTGPEKKKDVTQTQVYVIRWRPSQCSVDPIEEIILDIHMLHYNDDPKYVIGKLSELSGVPVEYIYCTEGRSFPVEIPCLDIENKLEWYSISSDIPYSLGLYGDGYVIYYKDNRETMKELRDKERSEIQEAEEARS
uniref:Death domain-containing protein n=1 Tax=Amphimedon queenslandica TaxID=400682 RepID=A0A1X7TJK8_AMPQE